MNDGLTLFVVNEENQLCGTLTDGDIRRALIKNISIDTPLMKVMNTNYKFIKRSEFTINDIKIIKSIGVNLLPLVNEKGEIEKIINLQKINSVIPVDAVIMAGGRGERLMPLTNTIPKPMLVVGEKPIIEHNIDRLSSFGVDNIHVTLRYLGDQIRTYFRDGFAKGISIEYVEEEKVLGTFGAISLIKNFLHESVIIMNSDLLTNIDWEDFYTEFVTTGADMLVGTIPYKVQIPYAVLETNASNEIKSFKEKPEYTYYSNAGIYLVKKNLLQSVPENSFYNATDFIESLIQQNKKVISYSILGYWIDIGRHDDYRKACEDIKHISI
jgi:NDP-sugar pyrophosphorylase family protein